MSFQNSPTKKEAGFSEGGLNVAVIHAVSEIPVSVEMIRFNVSVLSAQLLKMLVP